MILSSPPHVYKHRSERLAHARGVQNACTILALRQDRTDALDYLHRALFWAHDPDAGDAPPQILLPTDNKEAGR